MLKYEIFDERKSMDTVGYLLLKEGGEMDYRKLMSLLYMAERLCAERRGEFYFCSSLAITPDGPVIYEMMEHIKGNRKSRFKYGWDFKINKPEGYKLSVKHYITEKHLGHRHQYFIDIYDEIYDEFGHMSHRQLSRYISRNFPECKKFLVNESLTPSLIDLDVLLKDLGYSDWDIYCFEERMGENEGYAGFHNDTFTDVCPASLEHLVNEEL